MSGDSSAAALILAKQLKDLKKHPDSGFSAAPEDDANIFRWDVMIMGPAETPYEGGMFKAELNFPPDFPEMPPKLRFTSQMWHPNVYDDGRVCISILHPPGDDQWGYERPEERWLPIHSIESILVSVISMLASPNDESPANLDAAKQYREDYPAFVKKVRRTVQRSQEE